MVNLFELFNLKTFYIFCTYFCEETIHRILCVNLKSEIAKACQKFKQSIYRGVCLSS